MIYSPDGAQMEVVGTFPGATRFAHRSDGMAMVMAPAFPPETFVATAGARVVVGDGASTGFSMWRSDASLASTWHTTEERIAMTASVVTRHQDSLLANNPMPAGLAEGWAAGIRAMPYPDYLPFFDDMLADPGAASGYVG